MTETEDSEDVNDFLKRIRELGDQRDKEDEERTRKLEEEILLGRKEREARRAERARSLSPSKSNAGTPHSINTPMQQPGLSPRGASRPSSATLQPFRDDSPLAANMSTALDRQDDAQDREIKPPPTKPSRTPDDSPAAAMAPTRSNTLSWQQRPSSRGSIAGGRPLSAVASEKDTPRSPRASVEPLPANDPAVSRKEIVQSLGAKDPSFFKQAEGRGYGSAAYRRNQPDVFSGNSSAEALKLPGITKETLGEPEKRYPSPTGVPSSSPSMQHSASPTSTHKLSTSASLSSAGGMRSPLPLTGSQRLEPPSSNPKVSQNDGSVSNGRALAMSPSQGRMSPDRLERPASPTKGLGGFVQSAMLKRSDSVNKRWSAQGGPGLSRGNSISSNRGGYDGSLASAGGLGLPRDFRGIQSREASPVSSSRPGSSNSNITITQNSEDYRKPLGHNSSSPKTDNESNASFVKPAPMLRGEVNSFSELQEVVEEEREHEKSIPPSPSKRWSPSKSSWLENAINKPDSPKPKAAVPQQPSWLSELNKAKQQRGSIDLGKSKEFKEVTTNGFARSPPIGTSAKPPSFGGTPDELNDNVSSGLKANGPSGSARFQTSSDAPKINDHAGSASSTELPAQAATPVEENLDQIEPAYNEIAPTAPSTAPKTTPDKLVGKYSPSGRAKPETPPKKDFTPNLRPRKFSGAKEIKDELEFKSVFGKLKRTQTQNYKAPDELKDNIMRGKAGLNVTGGPKQTERKDEFKESILKKKEGMKAGLPSASTTIRSPSSLSKDQNVPLPEALVKRQGLTRSGSTLSNTTSTDKPLKLSASNASKTPEVEAEHVHSTKIPSEPAKIQQELIPNENLGENFNTALAGILSRGPSPMAKGNGARPTRALDGSARDRPSHTDHLQAASGASQLSHMTKGRARGPKRRLPTQIDPSSSSTLLAEASQPGKTKAPKPVKSLDVLAKAHDKQSTVKGPETRPLASISNNHRRVSPRKPSTSIDLQDGTEKQAPQPAMEESVSAKTPPHIKQKPTMTKDIARPRKSSTSTTQPPAARSLRSPDMQKPVQASSMVPNARFGPEFCQHDASRLGVRDVTQTWQRTSSEQHNDVESPIELPTYEDEEAARERAGQTASIAAIPIGLGIPTADAKSQASPAPNRDLPASPAVSPRSPKSPPLPAKKPASIANRVSSTNFDAQTPPWKAKTSLSPNSEASRVLTDFFRAPPTCNAKFNIDTQSIISARSSHDGPGKIKTLRKQIFEVAGDGKLLPVPSHQEHILFEENLYLCTHVFGNATGTRTTEIYLWYGDAVPTSAVEDAQVFCRRTARENNGKLLLLKQGKETANFFQALGGIVITRRGSSGKASSPSGPAAAYMLCGRCHVGQIAFDEVAYNPASLCKGFPYIICTRSNKIFIWKGAGSGADELGCAKLIGMDVSLTGEIEEVEDGREPASFWEAFPDGRQGVPEGNATSHWQLKASCEKYATRLFSIDVEAPRPKSGSSFLWGRRGSAPVNEDDGTMTAVINEISPFAQSDLDSSESIHVLDAFFEIHILVPSNSKSLLPTFRAACEFTQEYGILVASAEDRPFVPVSRVVLGKSVPDGVKRAFRKWVDTPYEKMECVMLPLNESLRATQPASSEAK